MDYLIINIRVLIWHLQVSRDWKCQILRNMYHHDNNYPHGLWSVYKFFKWI